MTRIFLSIASILGSTSVILGAFASHGLKDKLSSQALSIWDTGNRYQMYHTLALVLIALLLSRFPNSTAFIVSGYAFIAGILIFSGSLYALSLSGIKVLGAITPIGGVLLISGWIALGIGARGIT